MRWTLLICFLVFIFGIAVWVLKKLDTNPDILANLMERTYAAIMQKVKVQGANSLTRDEAEKLIEPIFVGPEELAETEGGKDEKDISADQPHVSGSVSPGPIAQSVLVSAANERFKRALETIILTNKMYKMLVTRVGGYTEAKLREIFTNSGMDKKVISVAIKSLLEKPDVRMTGDRITVVIEPLKLFNKYDCYTD